MTATVETVAEQLDLAAIMPSEKVVTAVARSVTLSEADVATATVQVAKPQLVGNETGKTAESFDDDLDEPDDGDDFWHTSVGKFKFSLDSLPQPLQYIYQLLKELPNIEKPDILYYMLQCLNILVLHGDALAKAARDQRGFFIWCQENLLIKNLWELCNAEYSHICEVCVPLLLHCITLPLGSDVFWRVVQEAFHDADWKIRFTAVERVIVITRFMDSTPLRAEIGLQTAMATAFCHIIASMDDLNVHVAQRATLYLGTIHDKAVTSLLFCLESQFDLFIVDRPVVLQSLYQLHNSLSDRKVLSWEFFLNRFDTLFVEAQISLEKSGDIAYLRDLRNSENGSEILSSKISKAREALSQSDGAGVMTKTLSASFGTKWPYKRTMSAPANIIPRQDSKIEKEKVYNRQISAPILKRKSSRFGLGQFLSGSNHSSVASSQSHSLHQNYLNVNCAPQTCLAGTSSANSPASPNILSARLFQEQQQQLGNISMGAPDGHIYSFGGPGDETNLAGCLSKIIDLEESDKETMHLLVFLLMQFLSRTDQAYPTEEKPMVKSQTIVLRHLYLLLGYSQLEKTFHISPERLRYSAVFNVFLANLPQVLDQNNLIGLMMIPTAIQVLLYAPNPSSNIEPLQTMCYNYSLWYLEPHARRNWLMTSLVVLYKYQYTQPPFSGYVNSIIRIIINSLEAQFHQCRRIPATVVLDLPQQSRSRDLSQPSLGTDSDDKLESPPLSPMYVMEGPSYGSRIKGQKPFRKYQDSSLDADDTESELVAIPESDLSDSTLHNSSAPGSFDDTNGHDYSKNIEESSICFSLAKLGSAHLAMTSSSIVDRRKETFTKNSHKVHINKSEDEVTTKTTKSSLEYATTTQKKCSVQEGVRMMVTPMVSNQNEVKEKAILNPPVVVQKAIVVTQNTASTSFCPPGIKGMMSASKMVASIATNQMNSFGSLAQSSEDDGKTTKQNGGSAWNKDLPPSPTLKMVGRQKPVVELNETHSKPPTAKKHFKTFDTAVCYGSPESPLSKMSILSTPCPDLGDLLSPKSVSQLELPTPERLLPIGQHGKEGITALVDKVREALTIPDISHLKQESLDKSDSSTKDDGIPSSRTNSPRRLIKQVALDSPPNQSDEIHSILLRAVTNEVKVDKSSIKDGPLRNQRGRLRKVGLFAMDSQSLQDDKKNFAGSWEPLQREDSEQEDDTLHSETRSSSFRVGDDCVCDRCSECGAIVEQYSDEEIGLFIINLGTFIHREPALAAPFLPEILAAVSKVAMYPTFPWQFESSTHLPGGSTSIAHQFLRCVLHQLAPNGVFVQVFQTQANESQRRKFFRSVAQALMDFTELNPTQPVQLLAENLNSKKQLPIDTLPLTLRNLSEYLQCVSMDGLGPGAWTVAIQGIETLFRRLVLLLPTLEDGAVHLLTIMVSILKIPGVIKGVLDPFSKILSYAIQNLPIKHKVIHDLCYLNNRAYGKERDKLQLCRQVVFELVQALKFKTNIPDGNILLLVGFVLQDAGGALPHGIVEGLPENPPTYTNNAADCMRGYMNDVLDFLADFHTLSKIKNFKNGALTTGLSEDTLGGVLKGAVAQYLALEMSRGNSRDNKAVARYLPWLYNPPSTLQQGPKEFTECVGHMRLLSWLLMGSLTHTSLLAHRGGKLGQHGAAVHYHMQHPGHSISQPVPQDASCHIADHIQVIFAGFAEQSKTSVLHMSSLFHAFTLCQLWTVYLEQSANAAAPSSESHNVTMGILLEFWAKVTPCILQLVSHSKVLSEMVNLHFLSLLEALKETRSTILGKLLPLWSPVLSSNSQLSGTLHVRLQNCRDLEPDLEQDLNHSDALLKWLQRLQFKMGQIELQSSTATQFYSI